MTKKKKNIVLLFVFTWLFSPLLAQAAIVDKNPSSIGDLIIVVINIANWILGISAAAALLAFIVGGLMMIFSAGNKNTVEQGKSTLIGATIGLVIVFSSFLIINFAMKTLGYNKSAFGAWERAKNFKSIQSK